MSTHPVIFGFDFGSFLPGVAQAFWDTQSRNELAGFFEPIAGKYTGAPRTLAQVLERIDLCIAKKTAQQPGVTAFLERY